MAEANTGLTVKPSNITQGLQQPEQNILADLHEKHKERQARIKAAAVPNQDPPPIRPIAAPPEEPVFPVKVVTGKALEVGMGVLRSQTSFEIILHEICEYYKVRKEDILSDRRLGYISDRRHMLVYMMYLLTSYTSSQIATRVGRDYSTVNYAIKKIQRDLPLHRKDIEELEVIIRPLLAQKRKT